MSQACAVMLQSYQFLPSNRKLLMSESAKCPFPLRTVVRLDKVGKELCRSGWLAWSNIDRGDRLKMTAGMDKVFFPLSSRLLTFVPSPVP